MPYFIPQGAVPSGYSCDFLLTAQLMIRSLEAERDLTYGLKIVLMDQQPIYHMMLMKQNQAKQQQQANDAKSKKTKAPL